MPETPTQVMPQVGNGTPPTPPVQKPSKSPRRWVWAGAIGALVLVLGAIAAVILLNQKQDAKQTTKGIVVNANAIYHQKLSQALTPVVAGNQSLSKALVTIDGSKASLWAAHNANTAAQQVTTAASGAVNLITVPELSLVPSQQATQALTQEAGYLQAVSSTLSDPTGKAPGSLQSLATATNSAFVPLNNVAPGGSASVFGVDNLLAWVSGATNQTQAKHDAAQAAKQKPAVIQQTTVVTPPTVVTPAPSGGSGGGLTACDQNISANANTSCGLAENVFVAYWNTGNSVDGWSDASITAQSPVNNAFYAFDCTSDGTTVNCSATGRTGNSLFVTFPLQAVTVY